ncbi:MAG: hypothetical protein LBD55_02650, partial [Treponema sp.]|nr:hypothetical protein [Treponema sp.]
MSTGTIKQKRNPAVWPSSVETVNDTQQERNRLYFDVSYPMPKGRGLRLGPVARLAPQAFLLLPIAGVSAAVSPL